MQTFLTDHNFYVTAFALDNKRLVAQIKEAGQILDTIMGKTTAWRNHPIVRMWRGHTSSLAEYGKQMCIAYLSRFTRVHVYEQRFSEILRCWNYCNRPEWLRSAALLESHRRALIAKDPAHYQPLWPGLAGEINYIWYCPDRKEFYRGQKSRPASLVWLGRLDLV